MNFFKFLSFLNDYKAWLFSLIGALLVIGVSFTFDEVTITNNYVMVVWYVMLTPIGALGGLGIYLVVCRQDIVSKTIDIKEYNNEKVYFLRWYRFRCFCSFLHFNLRLLTSTHKLICQRGNK